MRLLQKGPVTGWFAVFFCFLLISLNSQIFGQAISINGAGAGRVFDGMGAISGGGATSPMLKDYPEPQRSQILDYLFKPKFGASMSAFFVEIPGDCNSTQGSEPSHMHSRSDTNFQRGYEWWLMREAKRRNPAVTLDAVAWGAPGWIGNGSFFSTDMVNYYITWIKHLKSVYGYDLDAIGGRNEYGTGYCSFFQQFKPALTAAGLSNVKVHGFDMWGAGKWDFVSTCTVLDVLSAHTTNDGSQAVPDAAKNSGKPIWDTEEHAYIAGWDLAPAIVQNCNLNYINNRVTKTVFWYLIEAYYSIENFTNQTMAVSNEPWSGNYRINPGLWGYAHYGQFTAAGWKFIDGACGRLSGGGTYVTLKSPDNAEFSVIIETRGASGGSTPTFTITGGLPTNKTLCVWKSNSTAQFVKQADITPANGSFSLAVDANSIYSISTTTGQQKGSFTEPVPASKAFPFPYCETYDHYTDPKDWGYLPYYHCDIDGVFEITNRPDGTGKCLRQVVDKKGSSWAPEWAPYTIIGNTNWTDYEVSADVYFDNGGWASVLGRVTGTGSGYGCYLRGYYLRLSSTGAWALMYASAAAGAGTSLASGTATLAGQWHNVKLRFSGTTITGFIENNQVFSITNGNSGRGCAGLGTGDVGNVRNTAMFDNLIINTVGGAMPQPTVFGQDATPIYAVPTTGVSAKPEQSIKMLSSDKSYTIAGTKVTIPRELAGRKVSLAVYDLKGALVRKITTKDAVVDLRVANRASQEVRILKLKAE